MKIIGNPNGEFRGKRGGDVFSRNKSGPISRSYVRPTNRNSTGQQRARARMATASQTYKTLTSQQIGGFSAFAKSGYNPSGRMNTGQMSSSNAFTALAVSALNGAENGQEASFEQNSLAIDAAATFQDFAISKTAPLDGLSSDLATDLLAQTYIPILDAVSLASDYKPTFEIKPVVNGPGSGVIASFESADTTECGLMLTMSTANAAEGRFFRRNDIQTLAIIKAPGLLTGSVDDGNITVTPATAPDYSAWAVLPPAGSYVNIGLWLIAPDGRKLKLGYKETLYSGS